MTADAQAVRWLVQDDNAGRAAGAAFAVAFHVLVAFGMWAFDENVQDLSSPFTARGLCEGRRCPAGVVPRPMRGMDPGESDLDPIQATVIPQLGMTAPDPRRLPELQKYEQPEKIEDGVNISQNNARPEPIKFKAFEHKKALVDRRKKSLSDLLSAPEDEDERKRPTKLSSIIGRPEGSVMGSGFEENKGDAYAGEVALAMHRAFSVPTSIEERDLRRLVAEVLIRRLAPDGEVLEFQLVKSSGNRLYDSAAVAAIKRFVGKEGGTERLPPPAPEMLVLINGRGMAITLDGRLFRR